MSTVRLHCSWLSVSTVPQVAIPAMFITTSMLPASVWISSAIARTAS